MDENIKALVESKKYRGLARSDAAAMNVLLENTQNEHKRLVNEGTVSGDIAQFTPILMPLVRNAYPMLIANEILGVQPMTQPTGYMYALVNRYTGDSNNNFDMHDLRIIEGDGPYDGTETGVIYYEGNFALVDSANVGSVPTGGTAVSAVYSNMAMLDRIFKNYTGPYTTAAGEALANDMREIGFSIERKSVEAKTRALKARYTVEMYQDLKAQHGLLADEELISLISNEVRSELDRQVIGFVNGNATIVANASQVNIAGSGATTHHARFEIEMYRNQGIKIARESALVGVQTRRAQGNVLVVSPMVSTMLGQIGNYSPAPIASDIDRSAIGGVVGTFDNQYKVVVDQFATSDYCTVLYKGADRRDAMGVFMPYVPLSFTRVTDFESGQPGIIAKTRYALDTIPGVDSDQSLTLDDPTRGSRYARTFGVDFADTILGG